MKKILLMVLDGFGIRESEIGNAIKMSNLPNLAKIMQENNVASLEASGSSVGLPDGIAGNSEVGHMTIGAGRVTIQPLQLINSKIKDKSFFENDILLDLMDYVNSNNSTLHIIGLISNGYVHSSLDHFFTSVALAKIRKVNSIVFHFITDGRDTALNSGKMYIDAFMEKISKFGIGTIGTICGRYYAMDRDNNYDRVKKAYDAMVYGVGNNFADADRCMDLHYKNNIYDEFINPSIITKGSVIKEGDGVLFMNYRGDIINELVTALTDDSFAIFNVKKFKDVRFASLFYIHDNVEAAYTSEPVSNTFGKYLADLGFKQSRIAETEKYPHVTYYFDGMDELSDKNLYKILIPSSKVARYDSKPEMSLVEVTEATMNALEDDFDFILVNFANPDMLGHTGNIPACVRALECCDESIGKIIEKAKENFYEVVITSDHGNCELMKDAEGKIITSHTTNPVPFVIVNSSYKLKKSGTLCDIIPTLVDMYEISKPPEMTGESLLIK